ncbi:hypothetical protein SDC9_71976 [bioreactor metagenome]|uniref:Uncharacterized protein n=1 Tax=bioreactor metagenome TaxID=1076179 RepID=A0A644YA34_9ZZZZ
MIWHAIHSGGGNVDEAFGAISLSLFQHIACAHNICGVNIFRGIEGKGGSGVNDDICVLHAFLEGFFVTNITLQELDLVPLGIIEVNQVNAGNICITVGE